MLFFCLNIIKAERSGHRNKVSLSGCVATFLFSFIVCACDAFFLLLTCVYFVNIVEVWQDKN